MFKLCVIIIFCLGSLQSCLGTSKVKSLQVNDPIVTYLKKYGKVTDTVNVYNAFHNLIIPIYYQSSNPSQEMLDAFDKFFNAQLTIRKNKLNYELSDLHFAYLYAEFMRLIPSQYNESRFILLKKYTINYWNNESGNVWSEENKQFKGKKARIQFILENSRTVYPKSRQYLFAVTDFDMLCMSIGTSLATIENNRNGNATATLMDISNKWFSILVKEVRFINKDRWLFQQGIWSHYPDYVYAGYNDIDQVNGQRIIENIGIDVSHFSRMPAYLLTLSAYFKTNESSKAYINRLIKGLASQFLDAVVTYPTKNNNLYRFKNYMDGSNGVFRYNYTINNKGYNPYKNPKHIFYGFWLLLGDLRINTIYQNIQTNFNQYYANEEYRWTDYDIHNSSIFYKYLISQGLKLKLSYN